MGELGDVKAQKVAFTATALGVGVAVLVIVSCCYFFFVQGSDKRCEQRTGEVYILMDEVAETSKGSGSGL